LIATTEINWSLVQRRTCRKIRVHRKRIIKPSILSYYTIKKNLLKSLEFQ
jgi:hypothetical protein